jgi:hypothetical protein
MAAPAPERRHVDLAGALLRNLQKAIQRRNVIAALAAARALPQLSLEDAFELTMLIARKAPSRYPRVAARWLQRLVEEHPDVVRESGASGVGSGCRADNLSPGKKFGWQARQRP